MYVGYVYPTILVVVLTALTIAVADRPSQRTAIAVIVGTMALATFAQASFFAISGGVGCGCSGFHGAGGMWHN